MIYVWLLGKQRERELYMFGFENGFRGANIQLCYALIGFIDLLKSA